MMQRRLQGKPKGAQGTPKRGPKERLRGTSSSKESPREPKEEEMESKEAQNGYQMRVKGDTLRNFLCSTNYMFSSSKTDVFESRGVDFGRKSDAETMYKQQYHGKPIRNIQSRQIDKSPNGQIKKLTNHRVAKSAK